MAAQVQLTEEMRQLCDELKSREMTPDDGLKLVEMAQRAGYNKDQIEDIISACIARMGKDIAQYHPELVEAEASRRFSDERVTLSYLLSTHGVSPSHRLLKIALLLIFFGLIAGLLYLFVTSFSLVIFYLVVLYVIDRVAHWIGEWRPRNILKLGVVAGLMWLLWTFALYFPVVVLFRHFDWSPLVMAIIGILIQMLVIAGIVVRLFKITVKMIDADKTIGVEEINAAWERAQSDTKR